MDDTGVADLLQISPMSRMMSDGRRAMQVGVRVKLSQGVTWTSPGATETKFFDRADS